MFRFRKILPGNYVRKEINGVWYIAGEEGDIRPQQMEFSDNRKSELIKDFIEINVKDSEEILNFTRRYGPIISNGLKVFKEAAIEQGKSLSPEIDKEYPIQEDFAFPEYQFKYFHDLVINIWTLHNDVIHRAHGEKLLWDFFRLLFQPYGWCDLDVKYLGVQSHIPLAMFANFYHQITDEINEQSIEKFLWITACKTMGGYCGSREINTTKYSNIEIPNEFRKCLEDKDFLTLLYVLEEIRGREIFDSLEHSFEELQAKVNLDNINDGIFQIIRSLGRILICAIVNEYITAPVLSINEKGDFVMEIGDKFLMNIIFDEMVVLCQFYEARKCKFRKCDKYFISKKGKEKNYCCDECADREIKYQIREGRRTKKERKPKKK